MSARYAGAVLRGGAGIVSVIIPALAAAQTSPFLTGATALQGNILAWLTPIAVILVMALGAMAMANRIGQVSACYGGEAQAIVENCGNTLILRCAGSEHGGTSQFAAGLIGEREIIRRQESHSREIGARWPSGPRSRSRQSTQQRLLEQAVLPAEIEQLPDLCGYLRISSALCWQRVRLAAAVPGP